MTDRSKAAKIKIVGARTIEGVDFEIGDRSPTRSIEVKVEWPDGKPVINASVNCASFSSDPQAAVDSITSYVDFNGVATCDVLTEKNFVVDVDRLNWKGVSRPVLPLKTRIKMSVPAGNNAVHFRFVIDSASDMRETEARVNEPKGETPDPKE